MIGVREKHSDSWLDPRCASLVAFKFGRRLWNRCKGRKGVCFTLTYDRSKYDSSRDLYRRSREEQHVALFMRKLSRLTGEDYKGKWICKMEFQQGGWVHWHIILLGPIFVAHDLLKQSWKRGHVWVGKLSKRNVFYLTKYIAKNSSLPAWLMGERPRSIKVVRVSPGFWGEEKKEETPDNDYQKWGPVKSSCVDGYVPLGQKLAKSSSIVVKTCRGIYSIPMTLGKFLSRLGPGLTSGASRSRGWLVLRVTAEIVDAVVESCARPPAQGGARRRERGDALHLIQTGNPDEHGIPAWLDAVYREEALQHAT